jgi:hypothetical protein
MTLAAGTRLAVYDRRSRLHRDLALATSARLGEVASTGGLVAALPPSSRGVRLLSRLLRETSHAATEICST